MKKSSHYFFLIILLISISHSINAQPPVSKKKFHLYLLAGQSNMAGRGQVEAQDTITHPRIWMLTKDNTWKLAKEPLHFDKPSVAGVGPGFAFAKAMVETDTNIVIGLIPSAVGGSPISAWEPGKYYEPTKSHPWDDALKRTKIAMVSGDLKGILWQQGESDSDSVKAPLYAEKLEKLVARFRKELNKKSLPFVAGTMAEFYEQKRPTVKIVNAAIMNLPEHVRHTAFVSASGLKEKGDQTHFDGVSARELGRRYAEVMRRLK
ncbi:sialate O-acetylesterase [Dyadobacter sp. CY323]|uniref:sialate O-acetylesterase n=1 Tax=Dyadobacter sp. CY323 TaxID=2907302 RepID=UPI001F3974D6|nr:sialate O-acetylesterase [Dyadobacter sp. CY323]MCE6991018.1 sialate O-acetylesterase [Dyadobacter sp. CY323]